MAVIDLEDVNRRLLLAGGGRVLNVSGIAYYEDPGGKHYLMVDDESGDPLTYGKFAIKGIRSIPVQAFPTKPASPTNDYR